MDEQLSGAGLSGVQQCQSGMCICMNIGIVLHVLWLTLVVTCAESSSVHKYLKKPVEKGDWR